MLAILHPNTDENSEEYKRTWEFLEQLPGIELALHTIQGEEQRLTEIYLLGNTQGLELDQIAALPAVEFSTGVFVDRDGVNASELVLYLM